MREDGATPRDVGAAIDSGSATDAGSEPDGGSPDRDGGPVETVGDLGTSAAAHDLATDRDGTIDILDRRGALFCGRLEGDAVVDVQEIPGSARSTPASRARASR